MVELTIGYHVSSYSATVRQKAKEIDEHSYRKHSSTCKMCKTGSQVVSVAVFLRFFFLHRTSRTTEQMFGLNMLSVMCKYHYSWMIHCGNRQIGT